MDFIIEVMAAFGGGVFASIIGGTNAFIFTGVTGLIGLALSISTQNSLALDTIASGPLFGPHVAFNSGVVALAIVKRRQIAKNNDINGTNTFLSLYKFKDTLATLAAGLTGITGYLLNLFLSRNLQLQLDTVALTIVICNILTRILIGKVGIIPQKNLSDRFENVNKSLIYNILIGIALSMIFSYVSITLKTPLFGFYISALSLILLSFGKEIPASHHISLVAGYAAIASNNFIIGTLFGAISCILGEYFNNLVNSEADTLIDMPSTMIALLSFIIFMIF